MVLGSLCRNARTIVFCILTWKLDKILARSEPAFHVFLHIHCYTVYISSMRTGMKKHFFISKEGIKRKCVTRYTHHAYTT